MRVQQARHNINLLLQIFAFPSSTEVYTIIQRPLLACEQKTILYSIIRNTIQTICSWGACFVRV